jgi:ATP-dependent helicase/nuclease subunit A
MPIRELQPEQAAAAYEITRHVSVTAGPGAGKTTVLVERYLHILRQHKLSIDQIVAITFTNRAANEMRERLRSELNQILQTSNATKRRHWLNYKRTLDGAVITTIHGFCARLLREFPVEARVDPQFVLLDEHRAAMLLESVVEEVLSEFISNEHIEVSRLTLGVGRAKLAAALADLYRDVRGQGLSLEELARTTALSHATETDHALALDELDQAMTAFLALRCKTEKSRNKQAKVSAAWPAFRDLLQTIPEHETLADYCRRVEAFRDLRPDARGDLAAAVKVLDPLVWDKGLAGRVSQVCLDLFASRYALEMVSLLTRIDERLNEEKQKISALDFDDLELRTLSLLERPEVLLRAAERYKFFLVDEFQDTNGLQRQLLERLALSKSRTPANLFIVGDRKQSIYGFRGADVDVFRELTATLSNAGGEAKPLQLNFRSQPPLISFFNHLFSRLFQVPDDIPANEIKTLEQLGYVDHESSEAQRELRDSGPLVELLITTKPSAEDEVKAEREFRTLDARQLAARITSLMSANPELKYSDIALLFRAMTQVHFYESVFRRANIPYQTVLGRGFYEREEITDLIQLLRFLDNKTDELALAAVLRSPLCGISDNALLALRCGPRLENGEGGEAAGSFSGTRKLYNALRHHREIAFIREDEHKLLDRAAGLISQLIARRHHYSIEDLLRFAVDESEYTAVVAANFDGAQRLANVERLFTLSTRFERSGHHLIRDFVRYVEEFEAIGSRESEGQIDEAANAVRLMTIHQAKGLEFPVVIIPELQRSGKVASDISFLLDRHHGLTLKVPDGRGERVAGCTFSRFEKRNSWREQFEAMRLLYVAATRARDRLILSGAIEELTDLNKKGDSWLKWIWQALELGERTQSGIIDLAADVQLQFTVNLQDEVAAEIVAPGDHQDQCSNQSDSLIAAFPLLQPVAANRDRGGHPFSVTQLINYQRCARQYYFDRVLQLPSADELAVWNNAEAPEPPANLTATLKGAVIHRFCERYSTDQDTEGCLRESFAYVVRLRQAQLADRLVEIDVDPAIKDLLPLARNYLGSGVFARVEAARAVSSGKVSAKPSDEAGLWSELSFRLRRPLGVLSGIIDKLLITRSANGSLAVEIIDFKTNRVSRGLGSAGVQNSESTQAGLPGSSPKNSKARKAAESQFAFDFASTSTAVANPDNAMDDALNAAAQDYQLQMQAYALALRQLIPSLESSKLRVTLHFLDPNLEYHLSDQLLEQEACERAIDEAMLQIVSSSEPADYPVKTAAHCRMCSFLRICAAGRDWLRKSHTQITQIQELSQQSG